MSNNKLNNFDEFELWIHDHMHQEFETSPIVMSEDLLQRTLKAVKEDETKSFDEAVDGEEDKNKDFEDSIEDLKVKNLSSKDKDSLEIPLGRRNDKKTEFLRGLRTFAVVAASIVFIVMAFKVNSLLRSDSNNSASMTSMYSTNSSSADSATADTSAGTTDTTAESADAYEITREAEMDEKSGSDLPSIEESLYGSTADGDATASLAGDIADTVEDGGADTEGTDNGTSENSVTGTNSLAVSDNVIWYSNVILTDVPAGTYSITNEELAAEQALYQTVLNVSVYEDISTLSDNYAISSIAPYNDAEGALDITDLVDWINTYNATGNDVEDADQNVILRVLLLENTDHILYLKAGNSGSVSIEDINIDGSTASEKSGSMNSDMDFLTKFANWLSIIDTSKILQQELTR